MSPPSTLCIEPLGKEHLSFEGHKGPVRRTCRRFIASKIAEVAANEIGESTEETLMRIAHTTRGSNLSPTHSLTRDRFLDCLHTLLSPALNLPFAWPRRECVGTHDTFCEEDRQATPNPLQPLELGTTTTAIPRGNSQSGNRNWINPICIKVALA